MRYPLLLYTQETCDVFAIATQDDARFQAYGAFGATIPALQASEILYSTMTATTIRLRAGHLVLEDGPAVQTDEQLSGWYLMTCRQRTEALALAAQIAHAQNGVVEVRPLAEGGFHAP